MMIHQIVRSKATTNDVEMFPLETKQAKNEGRSSADEASKTPLTCNRILKAMTQMDPSPRKEQTSKPTRIIAVEENIAEGESTLMNNIKEWSEKTNLPCRVVVIPEFWIVSQHSKSIILWR